MISFNPTAFLMLARLHEHSHDIWVNPPSWFSRIMPSSANKKLQDNFDREVHMLRFVREKLMEELGLVSSIDAADRIFNEYDWKTLTYRRFHELQAELWDRIQDDLARGQFFMVPPNKLGYYEKASTQFGEPVNSSFPSAQNDIESASKCYAFGRNTATVFHLMRVMEVGLRALGRSLNDARLDPKLNPTWERILQRCDDELKLPLNNRSVEWKANDQFFSDATANLRAVKNAWRNSTMHVERDYDEEQSLDVFNAVKGFMRQLATKLHE